MPGRVLVTGRKELLPDSLKGFHPLRAVSCPYRNPGWHLMNRKNDAMVNRI
jgi:hypothetical protein